MKKYLVAALVFVTACSKDSAIDMTPIDAQGEVIFISRRITNSADWQIFSMNADGTDQKLLSNSLVRCSPVVPSNNGSKLVFTTYENGYYHLYVIDKTGQNQRLLAIAKQYCGDACWSPDDNRIAFVKSDSINGSSYDIYSIQPDGNNIVQLTNQSINISPRYYGSDLLLFSSLANDISSIYKMKSDGSGKVLLTPQNKSFGNPVISPDKSKIAITSIDRQGSQIFIMDANGNNLKQITFTVSPNYFDVGYPRDGNLNPVWSPNSSRIAYVSYENGSPDIFAIDADGKRNKRLTDTPLRDESPAWTKDGNYILFSSNRNPNVATQIYIMRTEGQLQTPVTSFPGDNVYPAFVN